MVVSWYYEVSLLIETDITVLAKGGSISSLQMCMLHVPKNMDVKMPSTLILQLQCCKLHSMLLHYYGWIHNSEGKPHY